MAALESICQLSCSSALEHTLGDGFALWKKPRIASELLLFRLMQVVERLIEA